MSRSRASRLRLTVSALKWRHTFRTFSLPLIHRAAISIRAATTGTKVPYPCSAGQPKIAYRRTLLGWITCERPVAHRNAPPRISSVVDDVRQNNLVEDG